MEIVGLLVIVIIIVLIIFFSLTFRMRQTGPERSLSYHDTKIANQLGPVITETTIQCGPNQRKLKELITDCATFKQITCESETSCQKINQTIKKITQKTIDLDLEYELTIPNSNNEELITNLTLIRTNTQRRSSELFLTPIPSNKGSTTIRLRVFY